MAKKISDTAMSLLALLNNVDELLVKSNNRQDAKEVLRAFYIYASAKNFTVDYNKIEHFNLVLLDYPTHKLSNLVKDIAQDVMKTG